MCFCASLSRAGQMLTRGQGSCMRMSHFQNPTLGKAKFVPDPILAEEYRAPQERRSTNQGIL